MFSLFEQVLIVLLSFRSFLATKFMSLNDELYMMRPTAIDLNSVKLKYYPFMIGLDKCSGICNFDNELSTKTCVPSKIKDINAKAFNMITNKYEAKTLVNIFHVIVNVNLIVQLAIQVKNGIIKHVNVNVKIMAHGKMIIVGILAHPFLRMASI